MIYHILIIVKPTNHTIFGGEEFNISSQVNLTCTVIGVPLPAIVWQLNGNDINLPSDCVVNSYNATLDYGSGSGFPDCRINQTLNLLDDVVANTVTDPQDIITLGMYELNELVVESRLTIRSLERSDNGSYTCNVTNMLPETDSISVITNSTPVIVLGKECTQLYNNGLDDYIAYYNDKLFALLHIRETRSYRECHCCISR